jgi:TRAP-type mannitol/chloroaromatic compound transport system substrate-binding protein
MVKTKSEYDVSLFEDQLVGKASSGPIIFIGKTDADLLKKIEWKFDAFGMKYGWHEGKAVLLVEKKNWNETEVKSIVEFFKQENMPIESAERKSDTKEHIETAAKKLPIGLNILKAVGTGILTGIAAGTEAAVTSLSSTKIQADKIFENQQKYLVNKFYTAALAEFLETL